MNFNFFSKSSQKIKNFLKLGAKSGVADDVAKAWGGDTVKLADVFNGNIAEAALPNNAETFLFEPKKGIFNKFIDKVSNTSVYKKTEEILNTVKLGAQEVKNAVIGKNIYETLDNGTEVVKKGSSAFNDGAIKHFALNPEVVEYGQQEIKQAQKEGRKLHRKRLAQNMSDYKFVGRPDAEFRTKAPNMTMDELTDEATKLNIDATNFGFKQDIIDAIDYEKADLNTRNLKSKYDFSQLSKQNIEEPENLIDKTKGLFDGLNKDGIANWVKENQLVTASAVAGTGLIAHGLLTDD